MSKQIERTGMDSIQKEAASPEVEVRVEGKRDVGGASTLHSELGAMADDFRMSGFKCVHQECGLVHGHDTTKHRGSDSFDMSENEAASQEFAPNCHCFLNEAARSDKVSDAPSPSRANEMAPVPDSVTRSLDKMY